MDTREPEECDKSPILLSILRVFQLFVNSYLKIWTFFPQYFLSSPFPNSDTVVLLVPTQVSVETSSCITTTFLSEDQANTQSIVDFRINNRIPPIIHQFTPPNISSPSHSFYELTSSQICEIQVRDQQSSNAERIAR